MGRAEAGRRGRSRRRRRSPPKPPPSEEAAQLRTSMPFFRSRVICCSSGSSASPGLSATSWSSALPRRRPVVLAGRGGCCAAAATAAARRGALLGGGAAACVAGDLRILLPCLLLGATAWRAPQESDITRLLAPASQTAAGLPGSKWHAGISYLGAYFLTCVSACCGIAAGLQSSVAQSAPQASPATPAFIPQLPAPTHARNRPWVLRHAGTPPALLTEPQRLHNSAHAAEDPNQARAAPLRGVEAVNREPLEMAAQAQERSAPNEPQAVAGELDPRSHARIASAQGPGARW